MSSNFRSHGMVQCSQGTLDQALSPIGQGAGVETPTKRPSHPCASQAVNMEAGALSDTPLAYLVSRYPAVSHTFVLREVRALRELGFWVEVASINSPDRPAEEWTEAEREEIGRTLYIKKAGAGGALRAFFSLLRTEPRRTAKTLGYSLRLGSGHPLRLWLYVFYWVEALMLFKWMRDRGLKHLHVHFATAAANVALITAKHFPIAFSLTVHGPDEFYEVVEHPGGKDSRGGLRLRHQ